MPDAYFAFKSFLTVIDSPGRDMRLRYRQILSRRNGAGARNALQRHHKMDRTCKFRHNFKVIEYAFGPGWSEASSVFFTEQATKCSSSAPGIRDDNGCMDWLVKCHCDVDLIFALNYPFARPPTVPSAVPYCRRNGSPSHRLEPLTACPSEVYSKLVYLGKYLRFMHRLIPPSQKFVETIIRTEDVSLVVLTKSPHHPTCPPYPL